MSQIKFKADGKEYTLEYTLRTAAIAEKNGLNVQEIDTNPAFQIPILVNGAFQAHHKGIPSKQTNELYASITKKNDFISALVEMYAEAVNALVDTEDESDEGNPNWTRS